MDLSTTRYPQHLAIARGKLEKYSAAAARFELEIETSRVAEIAADDGLMDVARIAQHEVRELWHDIWAQLDAARDLAHDTGRDTAPFDAIRDTAREHGAGASLDIGMWRRDDASWVRDVSYHVAPSELVVQGVAALASAVPEAAVPEAEAAAPAARFPLRALAALGIVVAIAIVAIAVA